MWGRRFSTRQAVLAGSNQLTFAVPTPVVGIPTYMRFRFSSIGGLAPTGIAADGEVEDYVVTIAPNPWQNPRVPANVSGDVDVNGLDIVSPLDALYVINLLNLPSTNIIDSNGDFYDPPVPGFEPPPYYDVDGNGSLEPIDALIVINYLNSQGSPSSNGQGEGAAEGEAASYGLAAAEGARSLVNTGLDAGLLGGSLLVTSGADADANVVSAAVRQAGPVVDTRSISPATGNPGGRTEERVGQQPLTDLQAEDLEDLLEELVGETGDQIAVADARDAVFARLGA